MIILLDVDCTFCVLKSYQYTVLVWALVWFYNTDTVTLFHFFCCNSMHCFTWFLPTFILSHVDLEKAQHVILNKVPGQIIKKQHSHLALEWNYNQVLFSLFYLSLLLGGKWLTCVPLILITWPPPLSSTSSLSNPARTSSLSCPPPAGRARSSRKPRCQRLSWQAGAVNPLLWLVQL